MRLFDVSVAAGVGSPEWPGDTPFQCGWTWAIARGDSVNVSAFTTSPHVGTHADAPLHVRDGGRAADELPLEPFLGHAYVRGVRSTLSAVVELSDLVALPRGPIERLLLRTGASVAGGAFPERWPTLSVAAVRTLLDRGLRLLGVDAPSVDARESTALDVHQELFGRGAYNLENLDLSGVDDGEYELIALPAKLRGLDAAPVRAALRDVTRLAVG